jgi:hypothetical protein
MILFILLPALVQSQFKVDSISKEVSFINIRQVEANNEIIHNKVQEWIAINYNESNEVVQLNTTHKIILKGQFAFEYTTDYDGKVYSRNSQAYYTMNLTFKDNKYRVIIVFNKLNIGNNIEPISSIFISSKEDFKRVVIKNSEDMEIVEARESFLNMFFKDLDGRYKSNVNSTTDLLGKFEQFCQAISIELYKFVSNEIKSDDW